MKRFPSLVPLTRAKESPATGRPATENTVYCTQCVKSPGDRITVACLLLSLEDKETDGRQQNHAAECKLSDRRQSAWRLDVYTREMSQIICKLSCI